MSRPNLMVSRKRARNADEISDDDTNNLVAYLEHPVNGKVTLSADTARRIAVALVAGMADRARLEELL